MNSNIVKMIIRPSLALVVAGALILLASTIILAITNGSHASVYNVNGIGEADSNAIANANYVSSASFSRQSYGQKFTDMTITTKVKSNLLWSAYRDASSMYVATRMGKVTLTGSTGTVGGRELAGWIARSTSGVVEVDNKLVIKQRIALVL